MRLGTIAYGGGATLAASLLVIMGFAACSSGNAGGGFVPDGGDAAGSGATGGTRATGGSGGFATGGSGGLATTGGSGGLATGGSGGSGTGGSPPGGSPLGGACTESSQCPAGLTCVTNIGGQTLPGGLCTTTCGSDAADPDAECAELRVGALCIALGPEGAEEPWCVEPCVEGQSTACHGRQNAACFRLVNTATQEPVANACIPLCSNDAHCAPLVCNGESGLCAPTRDPGTLPIGSPCDVNALTDQCANGFCAEYDDAGNAFCTAYCRGASSCGWTGPTSGTTPQALCALTAAVSPGPVDVGFCAQTCGTSTPCLQSLFVCSPDATLASFGLDGICFRF